MLTPQPSRSTGKTTVDFGQVGINYVYVRDYADDACTWLESVMENPEAIPAELQDMLQNPLAGIVTKRLPVLDVCDQLIQWALAEPGGDNPALGDESGIFCYLDSEEERDRNMAVLASLGDDHAWVRTCKQIGQAAPDQREPR